MSRAQRLLRSLYTFEATRLNGAPVQAGALCWRVGSSGPEFLLVESRRKSRWVVPKGWTLRWRPLHRTAEIEAWEEAGVVGQAENRLLALIAAPKSYALVGTVPWQLALYPLEVEDLAKEWPERGERQRRWFKAREAALIIRPRALAEPIARFAQLLAAEPGEAGGGGE